MTCDSENSFHCTCCNNSENSVDDILRTNVKTTWIPSQQTRRIDPMLVLCWTNVKPALGQCVVFAGLSSVRCDL